MEKDKKMCPDSCRADHDRNAPEIDLLSPLTIRGITLRNRIVVSPMCQYCSKDGFADDWHLVHLGSRAVGGASLIFTEATAVTAQGRISGGDLGIWKDEHIETLGRIAAFIHRMGAVSGIQLAHAGRKGSCLTPWEGRGKLIDKAKGGWTIVAPSPIPFNPGDPAPEELSIEGIKEVVAAFIEAAKRALKAGFKVIEVHAAHGYLLHSFLSPISNQRKDQYGGCFENRIRILLELVAELRKTLPNEMPLFVRISATDWIDGGWDIEQSVKLSEALKGMGVDLIDTSSGGMSPHADIPIGPGYQVPFARRIRHECSIMTGAVGLITEPGQANDVIMSGSSDLVFLAREMLRNPYFALEAEHALNQVPGWPLQYGYAVTRSKK
ncbi:MAG TPA: NADH:flavin oxidoreductase/NADH oxidase [Parachlamydiaceae bacterium]|nr:NADH:flavin oxidoreductase/NADH oxidase [Parachlamydiaceae bacterium]